MGNARVELVGDLVSSSSKALQVKFIDASGKEVVEWFPLSQVQDRRDEENNVITLTLPQWLAEDRGVV